MEVYNINIETNVYEATIAGRSFMEEFRKIVSKKYPSISLKVCPGHFATGNSHINYFIDLSSTKARINEADTVARAISERYFTTTIIDTIVCLDGCEVIGAFLAQHLSEAGIISMNQHQTIYVTAPEYSNSGQFIFRDNLVHMIRDKYVLLLLASATTGKTISSAVDAISYYGGKISGISAVFSAIDKIYDYPVNSIFTAADIGNYEGYEPADCQMCRSGKPLDAIVNSFGYAKLRL